MLGLIATWGGGAVHCRMPPCVVIRVCAHMHRRVVMECVCAFGGLSGLMGSIFVLWNMFAQ